MEVEFFNDYKNQSVVVLFDKASYEMILDEVVEKELSSTDGSEQSSSFSLMFSSDNEQSLNQGLYRFKFGEELKDIFIVPMSPENGKFIYQAVFN